MGGKVQKGNRFPFETEARRRWRRAGFDRTLEREISASNELGEQEGRERLGNGSDFEDRLTIRRVSGPEPGFAVSVHLLQLAPRDPHYESRHGLCSVAERGDELIDDSSKIRSGGRIVHTLLKRETASKQNPQG